MSTIPLPALDVKPVQQPDVLGQYGKLIALQNAQQQGQMGNIQLQQAQLQLQDQQKMRQITTDPSINWSDPKALDQVFTKAQQAGVSLQTLAPLQQHVQEMRSKIASTDKTTFENSQAKVYSLYTAGKGILQLPPEQRPAAYQAAMQQLSQQLGAAPQGADQQYPGDDAFAQRIAGLGISHSMYAAEARNRQATTGEQKEAAELPGQQAKSQQAVLANAAAQLSQAKDDSDYQAKLDTMPRGIANKFPDKFDRTKVLQVGQTPEQITTTEQGAQRVATAQGELAVSRGRLAIANRDLQLKYFQNGFDANGNPITNENASPVAKQIVAGNIDPATYRAQIRRNPGLMNQVLAIDPNFDETKIDKRFAFNKQLTNMQPSGIGGQTLALNTLVHHSDLLYDMVDGLNNGSFRPGNQLYNSVKTTFGAAPATNFNSVRDFVVSEAAKIAHGGVPNESDITRSIENLKSSGSPEQLKQGIDKILSIAGGKMQAINEQGQQAGMGPNFTILGKEAKDVVQKHGIDPTTLKPVQQGGGQQQGPSGGSGMAVSLATAKQLPQNKGKTDDQIRQDIQSHGHQVVP